MLRAATHPHGHADYGCSSAAAAANTNASTANTVAAVADATVTVAAATAATAAATAAVDATAAATAEAREGGAWSHARAAACVAAAHANPEGFPLKAGEGTGGGGEGVGGGGEGVGTR